MRHRPDRARVLRGPAILLLLLGALACGTWAPHAGAQPSEPAASADGSTPPPTAATTTTTAAQPIVQTIVFTSGVSGHFADARCAEGTDFTTAPFARYAGALTRTASTEGAFAFDSGGFFEPHGVGRYALDESRDSLATMASALGYDALSFAAKDLQAPRESMILLARALATHDLRMFASNLRCDERSGALCDAIEDASDPVRVFESGTERVAFLAMIDPGIMAHVDVSNRLGITLEPLAAAFHRRVAEARALGATLIIASVDNGSGARASGDAVALAESLPEGDRPDLLVSARAGRQLLYARPASFHPPIAAAPPERGATVEVRRRADDVGFEMLVRPLAPQDGGSEALSAFVAELGPRYCADLGEPMAGARLGSPLATTDLANLTGGAMRVAAQAEIAFLNLPLLDESFARPAGHVLSASDVQLAVQFDDPLVVAEVDATWLQTVARRLANRPDIRMVGLAITNPGAADEAITVNGRALEMRGRYRIVVSRYLSAGGDDALPAGPSYQALGDETVRESLLTWLRRPREDDPRAALPDPARALEWTFALDSDTAFGSTTIRNPGGYEDTQFARSGNFALGSQNQLDLLAQSTRVSWENQMLLRYRTTVTRGGAREESDDLASFRSTFAWREPRSRNPAPYVPEPYGEAYLETEFTVPSARDARHFLVRPTLGARFTLTSVLTLKLQAGGNFELFDRSIDPSPGVGAVLTLASWKFFEVGARTGTLEGTFDWFFSGLGTDPLHTLRGNAAIAIQLNQVLGLSFTSTLFAAKTPDAAMSIAVNTTANLRLQWFVRTQRW